MPPKPSPPWGTCSLTVRQSRTTLIIGSTTMCRSAISQLKPNQKANDVYGTGRRRNHPAHAEGRFIVQDGGGTTAPPSLNTAVPATPTPVTTGTATAPLTDSAMLTGGYNPGGTITFYLLPPGSTSSTPLSGAGSTMSCGILAAMARTPRVRATIRGDYVPTTASAYRWVAVYSGDTNNAGANSPFGSEPETAGPASPSLTTTPGGTVSIGSISINGTKYLDATGNGFSSGDTLQASVTIDLYNSTAGLGTNSGFVAQTTTASNGTLQLCQSEPRNLLHPGSRAERLRTDRRRPQRLGRQQLLHDRGHKRPQLLRL